ncbi:TfoX/Sxy family protein [Halomonas salina]|uniref:Transcriptional regulator n=1 Tax=Halomonas salina TaxID=42565 RepID=A0ABR4WTW8_9GAMM|nr:TfoX/Sxy family protein [Halomonas salina]KGE78168.1 transcriptional regulator [Halomonas salina]
MSEYTEYLRDVFVRLGPIDLRRMFGGHGVYHDGVMFALVVDETLYLQTDAGNVEDFEREGLPAFEYLRRGKVVRLSYRQAPEALFEDPELAQEWACRSLQAARRGRGA